MRAEDCLCPSAPSDQARWANRGAHHFGVKSATADIAEALSSTVEATQQRLNVLMELNLVHREKFGRTYTYSLPVLHAADEILAIA